MIRGVFLTALVATAALAQTKWDNELKVHFRDGALLAIHTESSAKNSPLSTSGSVAVGKGDHSYRVVLDKSSHPIFAYDIEAKKSGASTVTLRIKPVDQEKLRAERWGPPGYKMQGDVPTLSVSREFPPLHPGDVVQVDILYHPATGEKIWDVLRVIDEPLRSATESKQPSGNLLSFESVRVDLNGQTIHKPGNNWMIGSAMMLRIPGKGDFYLTLTPPSDLPFQASGWVDHGVLRFQSGTDRVEVAGKSNLLQKSDFGTVWIHHVPETPERLAALERLRQEVARQQQVYTAQHPKLIQLRRELNAAEAVHLQCADTVNQLLGRE